MAKVIQNKPRSSHKPGADGLILGCQVFDEFRAKTIASLPVDLSEEEFKKELFLRIYGAPMEDFRSGKVTDADIVHEIWP